MSTVTQERKSGFTINGKPVSKFAFLLAYNTLALIEYLIPIARFAVGAWAGYACWEHNQTHMMIALGLIAVFAVVGYFIDSNERVRVSDFISLFVVVGLFVAIWHHNIVGMVLALGAILYLRLTRD